MEDSTAPSGSRPSADAAVNLLYRLEERKWIKGSWVGKPGERRVVGVTQDVHEDNLYERPPSARLRGHYWIRVLFSR